MVQAYVYNHMQQTACHAGQQQQPGLAHGGRLPETDGAKSKTGKTVRSLENAYHTGAPYRCVHDKALYKSMFTFTFTFTQTAVSHRSRIRILRIFFILRNIFSVEKIRNFANHRCL